MSLVQRFALSLLLLVAPGIAAQPGAKPAAASNKTVEELKPCVECHEQFFTITQTKHFVKGDGRTPRGQAQDEDTACMACHGDTSKHNRTPRVKGLVPVVFSTKADAAPQNEKCLACHQGSARILWQGSSHERTQQACASCHRAHAPKDPVTVADTQSAVCFECHKDRRAEMFRLSTHPMKTGAMSCSSCHQPHGSPTRALLQKTSVNDTCFGCHADKRGPFLWEHPSAKDDCTNCHNPHGTNISPMLKVRAPYLCQQCHQNIQHPSTPYGGTNLPPNVAADKMLNRQCVNCHVRVHGSNHPSGARFLR